MAAGKSGLNLTAADVPVALGMVARGDRKQDIAAWFGVNPARIAEAIAGEYGTPPLPPAHTLPPVGSPGVKGRRVRAGLAALLNMVISFDAITIASPRNIVNKCYVYMP